MQRYFDAVPGEAAEKYSHSMAASGYMGNVLRYCYSDAICAGAGSWLRFAPPAQRMHRSSARECNRVGAESWPASRSTRTRCRIGANRPPVCLRTQVVVLRPALTVPRLRRRDSGAGPSVPAAAAPAKPATAPKAAAAKTSGAKSAPYKGTEKFAERVIADTEHDGMRAATIHVPEKWHFESKIEWHYDWVEYPHVFSSHAENPDNAEAYFQYPLLRMEMRRSSAPIAGNTTRAANISLAIVCPPAGFISAPQPPMQALAMFIQQTRPNVTNFKWLGQQDLPDLAKALHLDSVAQPSRRCHQDRLRPERPTRGRGFLWRLLHLQAGDAVSCKRRR